MTIEDKVREIKDLFGLSNWTIILDKQLNDVPHLSGLTNAKTIADPNYNRATITVYPCLLKNESIWDEVIIHEMIHVVFAMYDFFADNMAKKGTEDLFYLARESSTSQMTSILIRIINNKENATNEKRFKDNGCDGKRVRCEKGESVFYASKNKGTIKGVEGKKAKTKAIKHKCE